MKYIRVGIHEKVHWQKAMQKQAVFVVPGMKEEGKMVRKRGKGESEERTGWEERREKEKERQTGK